MIKTTVYFVRHAKPDYSVRDDFNRPLTLEGIRDAKKVEEVLACRNIEAVYSSPYIRAIDTLKGFAENRNMEIKTIEDFCERRFGEWVALEDFKSYSSKQWCDFDYKLKNGESLREVQDRNIKALHKVIDKNGDKNVAIGTHGTALSTIINYYDPSFGYDGFLSIIDIMPYIIQFDFIGKEFVSAQTIADFREGC